MMYLLLRDNKQSGPYTFDELKEKGLKAYDLVWVEGRSAAWRYPSEIDELRAFAPVVEEQPFDRFFKKPAIPEAKATSPNTVSLPAAAGLSSTCLSSASLSSTSLPSISNTTTVKRAIYVTMPGGVAREIVREIPIRETAKVATRESIATEFPPARDRIDSRERPDFRDRADFPERTAYGIGRSGYRHEPIAEVLPPPAKRKSGRVGQLALVTFAVLVVLAAGIFIGLSIQKDGSRFDKLASRNPKDNAQPIRSSTQQEPVRQSLNNNAASTVPASTSPVTSQVSNPGVNPATTASNTGMTPVSPDGTVTANQAVAKPRHTTRQKADAPKIPASLAAATDSSSTPPVMMRREAVHRTDVAQNQTADKESLKAALTNQVSVGTNKFEVGTFGGIRNLQVTVTNRSAYALDLVVVDVSYIQANKKTYKTEKLYFRGIGPGSALMLEAPKTSRGINIQYKITSIDSKDLGLSEPGT
jgi:hypothetical protein